MRLAFIITLLITFSTIAQDIPKVDSLKNILNQDVQDTTKIKVLIDLNLQLRNNEINKASLYLDQGLSLAKQIKNNKLIYVCLMHQAYIDNMKAEFVNSSEKYEEAMLMIKSEKDSFALIEALTGIGSNFGNTGEIEKEIDYLDQALEISIKIGATKEAATIYHNLSTCYYQLGDIEKGIKVLYESIKGFEISRNKEGLADSYVTLGYYYQQLEDVDIALENYNKAMELYEELNNDVGKSHVLMTLGALEISSKNYEKAIDYLQRAEILIIKTGDISSLAYNHYNLGVAYSKIDEKSKEKENYEKAILYGEQSNSRRLLCAVYTSLGEILIENGKPNKGINLMIKAYDVSDELNLLKRKEHASLVLSEAYKNIGDFENAYNYKVINTEINDSLLNEKNAKTILNIKEEYETEQKERKIVLLKSDKEIKELQLHESENKFFITMGTGTILILILVSVLLYINQSRIKSSQKTTEMEQRLLRSQMNPHFLFNALNAIQSYIFKSEPAQAGMYLGKFAELIRMILENSRNDYVTLEKEILSLKHYLELQKLRFGNRFEYKIDVAENIEIEDVNIPPMLAQPFIENSIEHGIKGMDDGLIEIKFTKKNDQICFDVVDNGVGLSQSLNMKKESKQGHKSLATIITKERLDVIKREYKQKIKFNIIDLKSVNDKISGTKVSFQIPYLLA